MIEVLGTISHALNVARLEGNEDASPLNLTTSGDFANKPAGALDLKELSVFETDKQTILGPAILKPNGVEFLFAGGSAAGKTFGWNLFAWRNDNGMARQLAQGTGELGTQAVIKFPHDSVSPVSNRFWADKLIVTSSTLNWLKPIKSTDTAGNNTVASIWTDNTGYRYWHIEITNADGSTGTEAGDISVFWGYF